MDSTRKASAARASVKNAAVSVGRVRMNNGVSAYIARNLD
jgi:hypothetical protein